jgi:hypothetical protein
MYRTAREGWLIDATNRHRESRYRRRRMKQVLRHIRCYAEDWFAGWWLP